MYEWVKRRFSVVGITTFLRIGRKALVFIAVADLIRLLGEGEGAIPFWSKSSAFNYLPT